MDHFLRPGEKIQNRFFLQNYCSTSCIFLYIHFFGGSEDFCGTHILVQSNLLIGLKKNSFIISVLNQGITQALRFQRNLVEMNPTGTPDLPRQLRDQNTSNQEENIGFCRIFGHKILHPSLSGCWGATKFCIPDSGGAGEALPRFYLGFTQVLPRFYLGFTQVLPRFYLGSTQVLPPYILLYIPGTKLDGNESYQSPRAV